MKRPFSTNDKLSRSSGIPEQDHRPQSTERKVHVGQGHTVDQRYPLPPSFLGLIMSPWKGGKDQCYERGKCLREVKQPSCAQIQASWVHSYPHHPPGSTQPWLSVHSSSSLRVLQLIWCYHLGTGKTKSPPQGKKGAYLSRS